MATSVVYSLSEVWETSAEIPYWWHVMKRHYPDLSSVSDWLKMCFNQSAAFSLIVTGSGPRFQNKRSAFNHRLSFNTSYHTDREPVGCTCTCRDIFTQHCSDHSFSFYFGTLEFVGSLGNFAWLSSDFVSFILLLLNLITSTFHNQSKDREQSSSY